MATLVLEGVGRVNVSDDFAKLPPEQQQSIAEDIATQIRAHGVAKEMQGGGYVSSAARTIDDVVRAVARGATFGYADEFAAKMDELTGRTSMNLSNLVTGQSVYEKNLAREKARTESMSPFIRVPGEIGGAIAGTVATAPVRAATMAATGLSRVPALARSVVGGAAGGALYGSEEAGPGNRLSGTTAEGAAMGAVAGPVGMAVARGVGAGVRLVTSPAKAAEADIARALARDEITPEHAQEVARALGTDRPGATLADVGGENVKGLLERVSQTPGAGRTTAIPYLTKRQEQQASRIAEDLSELTGTKKSAFEAITETMQERATQGKPLYDAAMNWNARADSEVVKAWTEATETGHGKSILSSSTLRRNLQSEYGIKDIEQAPLMVLIDSWKKVADDTVGAAIRAGNKNTARVVSDVRDSVLDIVRAKNPDYEKALSAWAGKSRYLAAIEDGKGILSGKMSSEELTASLAKLGDSEKEAFRIGAVSSIISKMGNDPAKLGDMTKYLRSPQVREKITAIMPTPEAAAAWERRLNFEVGSSELVGRSLRGSQTARRLAEAGDAQGIMGDLVMSAFAGHPPIGLLQKIGGGVLKKGRDTLRSRTDREIAKRLTSPAAPPTMLPPLPGAAP